VEIALCKNSANAAYGQIMINENVVNLESRCLILAKLRGNLLDFARFPSSKTTVKYNLRFFVNAGTVHFDGEGHSATDKISRIFNELQSY